MRGVGILYCVGVWCARAGVYVCTDMYETLMMYLSCTYASMYE